MAGLLRERMKEGREKITAGRVWERGEVIKSFFFFFTLWWLFSCMPSSAFTVSSSSVTCGPKD